MSTRYCVEREALGSMGVVYHVVDSYLNKPVAVFKAFAPLDPDCSEKALARAAARCAELNAEETAEVAAEPKRQRNPGGMRKSTLARVYNDRTGK